MTVKLSLTSVSVFQFLTQDSAAKLAKIAKVVEKEPNDAVLILGETVPGIYVVASGKVGVYPPGSIRPLVTLGQGASFGEMSFLEKSKASATIRSVEKGTRLVLLTQADLTAIVDGDPEIGRAIYRGMALTLSQKLRATNDKIASELTAGRKLLQDLSAGEGADSIGALPDDMAKESKLLVDSLDRMIKLSGDLIRKNPDRAGSFGEIELLATELRSKCAQSFARLARHISAISRFVKTMEEFIQHSARD